jgi:hypothetical protein
MARDSPRGGTCAQSREPAWGRSERIDQGMPLSQRRRSMAARGRAGKREGYRRIPGGRTWPVEAARWVREGVAAMGDPSSGRLSRSRDGTGSGLDTRHLPTHPRPHVPGNHSWHTRLPRWSTTTRLRRNVSPHPTKQIPCSPLQASGALTQLSLPVCCPGASVGQPRRRLVVFTLTPAFLTHAAQPTPYDRATAEPSRRR